MDAVRIEDVIGDFVALRKRGSNYLGLCPFHADKNPSLSVSATKGIFKCFSCGKAGTAVSFIMDHEHLSYPEALRYLAKKYNIEIVEEEETAEEAAHRMKYESLLVVSEYAQKFYQVILWNTDTGRNIGLSYFRERQFTDETIRKFGLGYAADRTLSLHKDALQHGYKREYLVDSGLCIERDNGDLADRFFDRVMFPIYSISGRVIAFGGRTLSHEKTVAKYVNSPQSDIYDKSRSLYGIFQAKSAIAKADRCILVEGYADVISMHQTGICNVVASSGTALTVEQIRMIKRFTSNITLIYDGDEAGIKAALRGTDLILEEGMNVQVVLLPPEDDPDSFAKAHPRVEVEEYIAEHSVDFITFKSDILSRQSAGDPIQRARMINDIIRSISVIPDAILRTVYVETLAERFDQKSDDILAKIAELREKKRELDRSRERAERYTYTQDPGPQEAPPPGEADEPVVEEAPLTNSFLAAQERELAYCLVKFGFHQLFFPGQDASSQAVTVADYIRASLEQDEIKFENPLYRRIYDEFYSFAPSIKSGTVLERQEAMIKHFQDMEDRLIVQQCLDFVLDTHELKVKEYVRMLEPEEARLSLVVPRLVILYKKRIVEQHCARVTRSIAEAEHSGDMQLQLRLIGELQTFNKIKIFLSQELAKKD